MRSMLTMVLGAGVMTLATIQPGLADTAYPWCARYAEQPRACSPTDPAQCRVLVSGTVNCGFITLDQCRAALSGNGGSCEPNPMYTPRAR